MDVSRTNIKEEVDCVIEYPDEDCVIEYVTEDVEETLCEESEVPDDAHRQSHDPLQLTPTEDKKLMRMRRSVAAKQAKILNETPEERAHRLRCKKELNRRYFANEAPESKGLRLLKKSKRERRERLDRMLQSFHPAVLSTVGISLVTNSNGFVEVLVPWFVSEHETEEERDRRYSHQEQVIRDLTTAETPEQKSYRQEKYKEYLPQRKTRSESEEQRIRRLERCKELARLRRKQETPEQRQRRLEAQRVRTQRNREMRHLDAMMGLDQPSSRTSTKRALKKEKVIYETEEVVEEVVLGGEEIVEESECHYQMEEY